MSFYCLHERKDAARSFSAVLAEKILREGGVEPSILREIEAGYVAGTPGRVTSGMGTTVWISHLIGMMNRMEQEDVAWKLYQSAAGAGHDPSWLECLFRSSCHTPAALHLLESGIVHGWDWAGGDVLSSLCVNFSRIAITPGDGLLLALHQAGHHVLTPFLGWFDQRSGHCTVHARGVHELWPRFAGNQGMNPVRWLRGEFEVWAENRKWEDTPWVIAA
ncbi:MAG TPA: hypothetical protein PKE55_00455 [Kiritimatiellia bacterium]|nr:hypothetical protein [Kiritimatiellia bacterium]